MCYGAYIEVNEDKVKELFERIEKAEQEIYECYSELRRIGVVKMTKEPPAEPAAE